MGRIAVITILGDDDRNKTCCHWLCIIATDGYRIAVAIINRLHLYEINITLTG